MKKPDIILFTSDGMRLDSLGCMGNRAAWTPHMDALVQDGVAFRNAYCQSPVGVPGRCSVMTGLYPHTTGHRTMHFLLREDEPNLMKIMQEGGYEVIWAGRNDLIPGTRKRSECCDICFDGIHDTDTKGWTSYLNTTGKRMTIRSREPDYSFFNGSQNGQEKTDENCVLNILRYLDEKKKRNDGKPFFIYCSLSFPHVPYGVSQPWASLIDRDSLPPRKPWSADKPEMLLETSDRMNLHGWTQEEWNELRAVYLGMVAKWDSLLGMVITKLKELGRYDSTSVFVCSYHGDYTGDYDLVETLQNCFEDDLTNIPLIIKPAAQFACRPGITDAFAELVDLLPTIVEMSGMEPGYVMYGKSLLHVLAGDSEHKDAVFCEGGRPDGDAYAKESGHEDPHDPYWPRLSVQQMDGPHARATMIRMGNLKYTMRMHGKDELYDLSSDPDEIINQIDNPVYAQDILKMKLRMLEWYQQTADCIPSRKDSR